MTGRDLDQSIARAFFADGLATMVAGPGGGTGVTTRAEDRCPLGRMNLGRDHSVDITNNESFVTAAVPAGRAEGARAPGRGHNRPNGTGDPIAGP